MSFLKVLPAVGRWSALGRDSMDVSAAIKGRKSVRSYKGQEVESDKIEKILEAGAAFRLPRITGRNGNLSSLRTQKRKRNLPALR